MSSFGSCSVGGRTRSGRGASGVEREGARPHGGVEAGGRGDVAGGGSGVAGGDATPLSASDAPVRGGGRRCCGPPVAGPEVEPGAGTGGARRRTGFSRSAGFRKPGTNPALLRLAAKASIPDAGGKTEARPTPRISVFRQSTAFSSGRGWRCRACPQQMCLRSALLPERTGAYSRRTP